jgi:hypothetical protein
VAQPLTGYLNPAGRYACFDISREAIAWFTENVSGSDPDFDLKIGDVQNRGCNPTGENKAVRLPFSVS